MKVALLYFLIMNITSAQERDLGVCEHPLSDIVIAGEAAHPLPHTFHRLLQTISDLMMSLPSGSSLQQMALRYSFSFVPPFVILAALSFCGNINDCDSLFKVLESQVQAVRPPVPPPEQCFPSHQQYPIQVR